MLDTLVRPDAGPAKSGNLSAWKRETEGVGTDEEQGATRELGARFHVFLAFSREGLQRSGVRLVREEFARNVGPACWEAPCTYPAYEVCCS